MALTSLLTMIMFPFLILISLSAVVMGALNSKGRFFVPAMASSFFNLGSIIGGLGFAYLFHRMGQPAIAGMAVGTLIGGILQLGCQLPCCTRSVFDSGLFLTSETRVSIAFSCSWCRLSSACPPLSSIFL